VTDQQQPPAPSGPPRSTTPPIVFAPPAPRVSAPGVSAPPPPTGPPVGAAPNAPVPATAARHVPRRRRLGIFFAVAGGATVFVTLIGLVAWGASSLGQRIATADRPVLPDHRTFPSPADPRTTPSPRASHDPSTNTGPRAGAHHATAPLSCADTCITMPSAAAGVALTAPELRSLGTPTTAVDDYDSGPAAVQEDYEATRDDWESGDPAGDSCMFTDAYVPLRESEDLPPGDDGSVTRYLEQYAAADDSDDQAVSIGARAFVSSSQAAGYSRALEDAIALCRHYSLDGWDADVDAIADWPALPADITAVGWIEHDAAGGAYIGIDLQRGNLVVRTTLDLDADPGAARVEAVAAAIADRMERLPADGSSPPNA